MLDNAVLGKYWPGNSLVHKMDPRAKMLLSLVLMIIIFCAQSFIALGVCAVFVLGLFLLAKIPLGQAFRSILPLIFIVIITALFNIFFVQGGTVLFEWGFLKISQGGLYQAAFMGVRLILLLFSVSLLTLTTTTLDITDAFEYLLAPFTRIGIPAHELAMIMGIALRFLPQFLAEFRITYHAQISRGAQFSVSPFKGGLRMISSLVIPLFASAFRHAETLSAAMDARCYHGGVGRTRLSPLRYGARDRNAFFVLLLLFVVILAINIF